MARDGLKLLPRDYRGMGEIALEAGWTITRNRKHLAFVPPEGALAEDGTPAREVGCPATPGDYNSKYRVRGKLRRNGLIIPNQV